MRVRLLLSLGLVLALTPGLLGGCGGGSSEECLCPPPETSVLTGRYDMAGWAASRSPLVVRAAWGSADFDAAHNMRVQPTLNDQGVIDDTVPTSDAQYDVGLDGTFVSRIEGLPGIDFFSGGAAADGSLVGAAAAGIGIPTVFLFTRRAGTWTDADLDGSYHLCGYTYEQGPQIHVGWVGTLTFDGAGGGTLSGATNRNGIASAYGPSPLTYAVASDGAVTMGLGPGGTVRGTIAKGGDVIVVSGSTTPGGYPALHVLVPTSTSAPQTLLDGLYHVVGLEYDVASGNHRSALGVIWADSPDLTWLSKQQEEDSDLERLDLYVTHTVAPNGQLIVPAAGGTDNLLGAVSPTGDVGILGRVSDPLANPTVYVLIR